MHTKQFERRERDLISFYPQDSFTKSPYREKSLQTNKGIQARRCLIKTNGCSERREPLLNIIKTLWSCCSLYGIREGRSHSFVQVRYERWPSWSVVLYLTVLVQTFPLIPSHQTTTESQVSSAPASPDSRYHFFYCFRTVRKSSLKVRTTGSNGYFIAISSTPKWLIISH